VKHSPVALPALQDNYIWTLVLPGKPHFLVVDPGDALPVLDFAKTRALDLKHILITHAHLDHVRGLSELISSFPGVSVHQYPRVKESDCIPFGPYVFRALSTPGHTKDHLCYYEEAQDWLFCGDTLFSAGCGRVFDGSYQDLYQSLMRLRNLPDKTKIFCAHEYTRHNLQFALTVEPFNLDAVSYWNYLHDKMDLISLPSTIDLEKKINPFFRCEQAELQIQLGLHGKTPFEVFKHLRLKKDKFI